MSSKRLPSVLAAWAILFSGLTNAHAHVHLCFDGQEPPASVHLADGAHHTLDHHAIDHHPHDHHAQDHSERADEHDDVDVDVPSPALAKTVKYDDLAAIVPVPSCTVAFGTPERTSQPPGSDAAPRAPPPFSRPQLRAPPL